MSAIISFPVPQDGTSVSIAGSFNDWKPEDMKLSQDGKTYEKVLSTTQSSTETHQFKFVTSDGDWVLEEGRPTTADENGVLNHKIDLQHFTLETILDDSNVARSQGNDRDHIAPPGSVSVPEDLGIEAVDRKTAKNEYAANRPATTKGPGLVDPGDASIRIGDRASNTSLHGVHDSHLNPAAPAFSPTAPPFVPAANPPSARHRHSNSRSSQRQRSQSRSRTSHSRSSSVVSNTNRARSSSSLRHEELNPTAHEFRPQFGQPTNHIAHASGYAAALKKPASPPAKEEFKKPHQPVKSASPHPSDSTIAQNPPDQIKSSTATGPFHSEQRESTSYASIAKHGTSESSLDESATSNTQVSEASQRSALDSHKDPTLIKEVLKAGQEKLGTSSGNGIIGHDDVPRSAGHELESAIKQSDSSKVPDTEHVTEAAKSEREQANENVLDPAVEALKQHVEELKSIPARSPKDAQQQVEEHQTPAQIEHLDARALNNDASRTMKSPTHSNGGKIEQVGDKNSLPVASALETVNSSTKAVQENVLHALDSAPKDMTSAVHTMSNNMSEVGGNLQESVKEAAVSVMSGATRSDGSTVQHEAAGRSEPLATIELSSTEYDEEQIRLMDEVCILLDRDDKPIGSATKKDAHLMSNIQEGLLHRAFSLFIFNSDNKLLLQQRASEKITFPDMWTNTCCSHPLDIAGEVSDTLQGSIEGVKRAAQRKVEQELGIRAAEAPIADMEFLTRIHYLAPSDGKWGEHEIDYILFLRSTPSLLINDNEVRDYKWVSQADLRKMFNSADLSYTPWFKLICETFLYKWWDNLENLESCKDELTIHRMGIEPDLFERISHTSSSKSIQSEAAPLNTVSELVQEVGSTIRQESSRLAEIATNAQAVVSDNLLEVKNRVLGQAEPSSTSSEKSSTIIADSEPAAEDSLPLENTPEPEFEASTVQTRTNTTEDVSNPVSVDSEPAAEDSTITVPESRDPVESEIQESFGATERAAETTKDNNKPDAVLELSPAGQAKIAAHESTESETVSRPGTGKKSIRAKQNFFFYIFNSLFGGIFKGFSNIFQKLAFWRKNPNPQQQD